MDNPSLPATIMGAATSVIALGVVLLKGLRSRRVMPREPRVNREYERETYMNDILCRGDTRKEVDIVPYQPVRPEFFVPVDEPVPKHLQNVPLKIPAYIRQYKPYQSIPNVSAEKEKFDPYKN